MVSVSDVVTLLDTALGCFERVQIARSFDKDLNSHRIKLDIIQLRLSRWGEAAGVCSSSSSSSNSNSSSNSSSDSTALTTQADGGGEGAANEQPRSVLTDANLETAHGLLKAIQDQFTDAEEEVAKLQPPPPPPQQDSIDPERDLSSSTRTLRTKLRAALGRRWAKMVTVTRSVQWAFYKKQQFDEFVSILSENIRELEDLFPAKEEAQKRLCELGASDCAGINKVYLKVLGAVTKGCDPYLDAAVVEALKPREAANGGTTINMSNDGYNYGQQIGHMSGKQERVSFNSFGDGATNHWG